MGLASINIDNKSLLTLLNWIQVGVPQAMETRIVRKAMNAAGREVLQEVRRAYPFSQPSATKGVHLNRPRKDRRTGEWKARIEVGVKGGTDEESRTEQSDNSPFVYIALGKRGAEAGKRSYIPTAVEYGHKGPGGSGPPTPAHPFLRPAIDRSRGKFQETMARVIREELDKETRRITG